MANIKSAKKRVLIAEARRVKNAAERSKIKTALKKYEAALEAANADKDETQKLLISVISLLDKAARTNLIHKNAAARKKSRLTHKFNKKFAA